MVFEFFHMFLSILGAFQENSLTVESDMLTIVKAMTNPESGLEVKDRMWLKLLIPNSFIGLCLCYILITAFLSDICFASELCS